MPVLKIGDRAERAGTNTPGIRYYEEIGLLPRPDRQEGNQRGYSDEDVRRLTFMRRCRDFGFSIEQARNVTCAGGPGPDGVILEDLGSAPPTVVERRRA